MFTGTTVFVTGATGLIGSALCGELIKQGANIVALVRDIEKAKIKLPTGINLLVGDMANPIRYVNNIDYIIHGASNTSSSSFVGKPVETIHETYSGIENVLNLARDKKVKGMVFLSTMEVYGLTNSDNVSEMDYAPLDTMSPRSCYPEAKRIAECLCASVAKEYNIAVKVARLAQTFGAGVSRNDERVFAQFAKAVIDGQDIVLKSEGGTARCYCSVDDAVSAILTILIKGESGVAYNVANPDTFCTIREMAEMVSRKFSGGKSKVVLNLSNVEASGYLPVFKMRLNVDRLLSLGWRPTVGLYEMYDRLIKSIRNSCDVATL